MKARIFFYFDLCNTFADKVGTNERSKELRVSNDLGRDLPINYKAKKLLVKYKLARQGYNNFKIRKKGLLL